MMTPSVRAEQKGRWRTILLGSSRILSLALKSIAYIRRWGFGAFLSTANERLREQPDRPAHGPSASGFEDVYHVLLSTSLGEVDSASYVPDSEFAFSVHDAPVRLIALYLPQFHSIPENDAWWGRGFTEWTNVSKALPQFVGHHQPHLPGELGFYDLRVPEVQKRQVELARKYGIHGFAFYYYWFNGKRLLHKPLDQFLSNKEIEFPFCIVWANENWTRRWDGHDHEVLIAQDHSPESDFAFITDIESLLRHQRYIRIDGKPVLLVYRLDILRNAEETAERWRAYCRNAGIGEIFLIAGQVYGFDDPRSAGFDAAFEFPPHNIELRRINDAVQIVNPGYGGAVFSYEDMARQFMAKGTAVPYVLFKTVSPGWDNEPRKPGRGSTFAFSTPDIYRQWLAASCNYALGKPREQRVVFINAWNEWGEGAYLEPDRRFGYAYLRATAEVLLQLRGRDDGIP